MRRRLECLLEEIVPENSTPDVFCIKVKDIRIKIIEFLWSYLTKELVIMDRIREIMKK